MLLSKEERSTMTIPTPPRTQPRTWSPLPVATGPKAMPMRLEVKIDPR
jgi:hypothetical protein